MIKLQVVFDLRAARLTTARLYDRLDHTSYRTYDNFCPHEIRLTTIPTYDQMVGTERGRKSNTICIPIYIVLLYCVNVCLSFLKLMYLPQCKIEIVVGWCT